MKSLFVIPLVALMAVIFYSNTAQGHGNNLEYSRLMTWTGMTFTERFSDPCDGKWQDNWFLDGKRSWFSKSPKAKITNDNGVMTIETTKGGAVLWTKESYDRPLRIEYDFKRLDENDRGANIIFIHATGDGENGCVEDISQWSKKRNKVKMEDYYDNMHAYQVSYATYDDKGGKGKPDHIRGRRYLPTKGKGLEGTVLDHEHTDTGLFEDHQWVHVTITKFPYVVWAEFRHPDKRLLCKMENRWLEPIKKGRIGLFLAPKRKSQFKNFKIMTVDSPGETAAKREKARTQIKKNGKQTQKPKPNITPKSKTEQKRSNRRRRQNK